MSYKSKAEGNHMKKREGSMATKAEVTVMGQKPGTSGAPRGWGGKEQILPGL